MPRARKRRAAMPFSRQIRMLIFCFAAGGQVFVVQSSVVCVIGTVKRRKFVTGADVMAMGSRLGAGPFGEGREET